MKMKIFATIVSGMFHPLMMVTYGLILALTFTYLSLFPMELKLWLVSGTFLMTAGIPALFIYLMVKSGGASDSELTKRRERILPYLVFICALLSTAFFLNKMLMPGWLVAQILGACSALFIALLINFAWKISAHAIGIGGLIGGIMGMAQIQMTNPYVGLMIAFCIAGCVGTSRLILKRHTPMQVYAGFCLGFICIFVSSLLSYIYLFI